jgi:hypothetical protein
MSTIIQLDDNRRGVFPRPFKPGDTLIVESLGPEAISMHLLKAAEVP